MNNMNAKVIAIVAVIAMAFAGVAVYDAADATYTESANFASYVVLDGQDDSIAITLNVESDAQEPIPTHVTWTSSNAEVIAASAANIYTPMANLELDILKAGYTSIEFTYYTVSESVYTAVEGLSTTVPVYAYDAYDSAKVAGYASTTSGQAILYTDGTVLMQMADSVNELNATVTAGTETFLVSFDNHNNTRLNLRGYADVATPSATFSMTAAYSYSEANLGTYTFAPYEVTLSAINAKEGSDTVQEAFFEMVQAETENQPTHAISSSTMELTKNGTLANIIALPAIQEQGTEGEEGYVAPQAAVSFLDYVTAHHVSLQFTGYAAANDATTATFNPTGEKTIEEFIFGLATTEVEDVDTAYAVYEIITYQIFLAEGQNSGVLAPINETAAGDWTQMAKTIQGYTISAPRTSIMGDTVLLHITQTAATRTASYQVGVFSYTVAEGTGVKTAGAAIEGVEIEMLTNGIFAISGINSNVVIAVLPVTTENATNGYFFAIESVTNANDAGTAVARLNVYDSAVAESAIVMSGTYYVVEDGHMVFGSINSRVASGELVYSAVVDGVEDEEFISTVAGYATHPNNGHVFLVTLANSDSTEDETIGFYAVKGTYNLQSTGYTIA